MSVESERILSRYKTVEREADDMGRLITVRQLKLSEQTKILGYTPELVGFEEVNERDENDELTGKKLSASHRLPLYIAASVCEIDSVRIPFPQTRGELDAIYDRLDKEGLAAASRAFARLVKIIDGVGGGDQKDVAKNS